MLRNPRLLLTLPTLATMLAFPMSACNQDQIYAINNSEGLADWELGAVGGAGGDGGSAGNELSFARFEEAKDHFIAFVDKCNTMGGKSYSFPQFASLPYWSDVLECIVATDVCADRAEYLCADYPQEWVDCFQSLETFDCDDGSTIARNYRCDTIIDCRNGEDEKGCQDLWFQCDDKSPILASQRCNASVQCPDGSDEVDCDIKYFQCDNHKAIPTWKTCNQRVDCADESDEDQNCVSQSCN